MLRHTKNTRNNTQKNLEKSVNVPWYVRNMNAKGETQIKSLSTQNINSNKTDNYKKLLK